FSVSSHFEARLAREVLGDSGCVHLYSPAMRSDEIEVLANLCDYIVFNSISQWERFFPEVGEEVNCGIRINPGRSFVKDVRYDPCGRFSRLGVSVKELTQTFEKKGRRGLSGIHFHTNCDSKDFSQLLATTVSIT